MRRFAIVPVLFVSIAFLSGCNAVDKVKSLAGQTEQKPLTLVTPKGYAKPVPIQSAAPMSWEKKALLAMIAPSIAEQIEKQDAASEQHSGLKAPANQKPVVASTGKVPAASQAKAAASSRTKVAKASHGRKANRRLVAVASKHKKAAAKAVASTTKRASHAVIAAKF